MQSCIADPRLTYEPTHKWPETCKESQLQEKLIYKHGQY